MLPWLAFASAGPSSEISPFRAERPQPSCALHAVVLLDKVHPKDVT